MSIDPNKAELATKLAEAMDNNFDAINLLTDDSKLGNVRRSTIRFDGYLTEKYRFDYLTTLGLAEKVRQDGGTTNKTKYEPNRDALFRAFQAINNFCNNEH